MTLVIPHSWLFVGEIVIALETLWLIVRRGRQ
jgi:hypothetical protein